MSPLLLFLAFVVLGVPSAGAEVAGRTTRQLRARTAAAPSPAPKRVTLPDQQGGPQGEVEVVGDAPDTGTSISFLADKKIFESIDYDFDMACQRLREFAYLNKGVEIVIKDERANQEKAFYFDGGIASYIRRLNKDRGVIHPYPIYISTMRDSTVIEAAL